MPATTRPQFRAHSGPQHRPWSVPTVPAPMPPSKPVVKQPSNVILVGPRKRTMTELAIAARVQFYPEQLKSMPTTLPAGAKLEFTLSYVKSGTTELLKFEDIVEAFESSGCDAPAFEMALLLIEQHRDQVLACREIIIPRPWAPQPKPGVKMTTPCIFTIINDPTQGNGIQIQVHNSATPFTAKNLWILGMKR